MAKHIGIHVLHSVPVGCINRGEDGLPKSSVIGGVRRARISSQAQKRAVRENLRETGFETAYRTKKVKDLIAQEIADIQGVELDDAVDSQATLLVEKVVGKTKNGVTSALGLWSPGQIRAAAEAYVANTDEKRLKKELEAALSGSVTLDQALFGRMAAENPNLNIEASVQVAHAFSINHSQIELDSYTALDDLAEVGAGSAMMGTSGFMGGIFYRNASLNLDELTAKVGEELAVSGAAGFFRSFAMTLPSGKQNSFAHHTLPQAIIMTVSERPISLGDSYDKPDTSNGADRIARKIEEIEQMFGSETITAKWVNSGGETLEDAIQWALE